MSSRIKYLVIGLVFVFLSLGFAWLANAQGQQHTKQVQFSWEDTNEKTDDFRWLLFARSEGEDFGGPELTIPIADTTLNEPDYLSKPLTITITGKPGSTVTKYFALKAQRGQGATEETSAMSQESNLVAFTIPLLAPFSITVEVIIVPE